MKNIVLVLFAVALICSCSQQHSPQTYENPKIGLHLTYPSTWQVMKKDTLNDAIAAAEGKLAFSQEAVDIAKELAPLIILTLAKPQKIGGVGRNPNINVLLIPIPKEEWKDIDLDTLIQEQIADIKASIPGVRVTTNVLPLSAYPDIHNYSSQIPLPDRTITQYQYVYWRPPYFVQIAFGSSHPDDEAEIKEIIRSMKIEKSNKPTGGNVGGY
ncbi:MAG: hypothetical protein R6W75_06165 [Smithellaceae bacterium]